MSRRNLSLIIITLLLVGCMSTAVYVESGITSLVQITTDRSYELDPTFSKDGNKLFFASDRSGFLEIWAVPINGGGIQQITSNSALSADRAPNPSPDMSEVVFQSTRVTGVFNIWKISLGNRGLVQLTNNPYGSVTPKWSPDGKSIAYAALDVNKNEYVWTIGASGENPTQLGPGTEPDWSPDGKRIVFSKKTKSNNYDIWIMNADGTNQEQLTTSEEKQETSPVWSPDGKRITYVVKYSSQDYFSLNQGKISTWFSVKSEVWLMDLQGRNTTQLTAFQGINVFPAWSPDSKKIVFVSSRSNNWDIWTMVPLLN